MFEGRGDRRLCIARRRLCSLGCGVRSVRWTDATALRSAGLLVCCREDAGVLPVRQSRLCSWSWFVRCRSLAECCDLVLTDLVTVSVCDFQGRQDFTAKLLQFACDFLVRLIDCGSCALRVHQVDVLEVNAVTICDSLQPVCEVSCGFWVGRCVTTRNCCSDASSCCSYGLNTGSCAATDSATEDRTFEGTVTQVPLGCTHRPLLRSRRRLRRLGLLRFLPRLASILRYDGQQLRLRSACQLS